MLPGCHEPSHDVVQSHSPLKLEHMEAGSLGGSLWWCILCVMCCVLVVLSAQVAVVKNDSPPVCHK